MKVDKTKWRVCRLEEICAIQMGSSPDSSSYNKEQDGLPFYQGNADFGALYPTPRVFCNSPIRIAEKNDLLISVRAPIGAINLANSLCAIGRGLASIKPYKEYSNINFLRYLLISSRDELNRKGTGVTFKAISKSTLLNLQVTVPPLSEQTAIASELDSLQTVIDGYKAQLADLDALAQSVFLEMFGDPVENPKGWECAVLSEFATLINGRAYSQPELLPFGKYRVLRVGNLYSTKDYYYSDLELDNDKYIDYGDLIYAWSCTFGAHIWKGEKVIYHYHIWKIVLSNSVNKEFIRFLLNLKTSELMNQLHGVGMMHLTKAGMEKTIFPLPPLPLQTQFASRVEAIERQKEQIRQQLKDAETLMAERMQYYFG